MATTTPPRTPPPTAREQRGRPASPGRARPTRPARWLIPAVIAIAILVAVILLMGGSSGAEYRLLFSSAELLVKGNQVQVGGVPVGSVTEISLTPQNKALVKVHLEGSIVPLHRGTSAEIRVPSLSGVANRYVSISPGPNNFPKIENGGLITNTSSPVDLDELFNALNPATRHGLQQVIEGFALQYAGVEGDVSASVHYFPSTLRSLTHVFGELSRDEKTFTDFLLHAAEATSVIGARSEALTSLIGNADTTFGAIAVQQHNLARGLHELPNTFTEGTRTFSEIGPTLTALTRLVTVSKEDTKELPLLFERLRPLLTEATPVLENLGLAISRPGPNNDLTDAALELPALARVLSSASPNTVKALREGLPDSALFGPYSPDLQGLFRNLGQATAYYDADGHYAHVQPVFNSFKLGPENTLTPTTPLQGLEGLKTRQLARCPGAATAPAADGSSPFTAGGTLGCNPGEVP